MTEHKFGTWYPIEEFDENFGMVLFYNNRVIFVGETVEDIDGTRHYYDDNGDECLTDFIPVSWMPLPLPPGETND